MIVTHGVSVTCRDGHNNTLLHHAARYNAVKSLAFLQSFGVLDVNSANRVCCVFVLKYLFVSRINFRCNVLYCNYRILKHH